MAGGVSIPHMQGVASGAFLLQLPPPVGRSREGIGVHAWDQHAAGIQQFMLADFAFGAHSDILYSACNPPWERASDRFFPCKFYTCARRYTAAEGTAWDIVSILMLVSVLVFVIGDCCRYSYGWCCRWRCRGCSCCGYCCCLVVLTVIKLESDSVFH